VVPESSFARIASTRADIEAGHFGGRGAIWMAGLEVAREHPLVGVGAGAFQAAVEPTIHEEMVAHNVLLSVLVEDGLVGLLLFVAMITAVLGPLRHLPPVQRRFSIVLLLALALGSMSLSWDNRKQLWFVVGALAVQVTPRSVSIRFCPSGLAPRSFTGRAGIAAATGRAMSCGRSCSECRTWAPLCRCAH